ncbi:aspartyl/glutamyl-tRNA(Asn/Gln) amidotransferase subunit C [Planctomycetota bacterium]|nr:aspartyl/glutamyl-tRNA(Asn/Gln) amidotransferase subunit C [Planctomycetota bacterium]
MAITVVEVRQLARLASLAVDEAEAQRLAGELQAIVGYVEQLSQVDTAGIAPVANVAGLSSVLRPDVPGPMFATAQVLANAPARNEVAILVPKVVER